MEPDHEERDRERQAALNQALRRDVNERRRQSGGGDAIDFVCECSDPRCHEVVSLTPEECEFVRRVPNRLVVKVGHTHAQSERILVEEPGRFQILEKYGPGEDVIAHLDPRARTLRAEARRPRTRRRG